MDISIRLRGAGLRYRSRLDTYLRTHAHHGSKKATDNAYYTSSWPSWRTLHLPKPSPKQQSNCAPNVAATFDGGAVKSRVCRHVVSPALAPSPGAPPTPHRLQPVPAFPHVSHVTAVYPGRQDRLPLSAQWLMEITLQWMAIATGRFCIPTSYSDSKSSTNMNCYHVPSLGKQAQKTLTHDQKKNFGE